MKVSYKFSNVLGSVYYKGNILFAPGGDTVFSPTGNRITYYDLKRSVSQTLPLESRFNFTSMAISPNERFLIVANEIGEVFLIATLTMTVIYKHRLHRPVTCIRFSPDGKYFALTKENSVFVYLTPGKANSMYNPFVMYRALQSFYDETTALCWSADSRYLAVGSKDMCTRVFRVARADARCDSVLSGHNSPVVAVFLAEDTMDCYTLSSSGELCCWTCTLPTEEALVDAERADKPADTTEEEAAERASAARVLYSKRLKRHFLDTVREVAATADADKEGEGVGEGGGGFIELTAADYHQKSRVLVTAYSNGCFMLHELPDLLHIHSLSVSDQRVSSVCWNGDGDWIALACSGRGQLLVWEWKSESYVFKQQGHANDMVCVAYSPNAETIATGGHDGKVKLWHANRCYCFVTFREHQASVSDLQFVQSGRAVLSASLDGTVRAFDTGRYRNFRTLTSPRTAQFSCLAVDSSGEMVAAGSQDLFEIYLWSLQLGKLLEIFSGHEAPVSGICFSPASTSCSLASTSWDKTVRVWDVMSSKVQRETFELHSEGMAVQFRPDGQQLAVSTLSGQIQLLEPGLGRQVGSIEGRTDLATGRSDADQITAKKKLQAKAFTTLAYSADGRAIIAAGNSKNICFYHVQEALLVAKFEVTQNRSLDAVDDYIHRRKMGDFGNLALVEQRREGECDVHLRMPGAKYGDMAARALRPEVRVLSVRFSPAGDSFCAVTTEGLLIYSLSSHLQFAPFQLTEGVTKRSVLSASAAGNHGDALTMAFQLNLDDVTRHVIEHVPVPEIDSVVSALPLRYIERLFVFLSTEVHSSRHLQFFVMWIHSLLLKHTDKLRHSNVSTLLPHVKRLQRSLTSSHASLLKLCDSNRYQLDYLCSLSRLNAAAAAEETNKDE